MSKKSQKSSKIKAAAELHLQAMELAEVVMQNRASSEIMSGQIMVESFLGELDKIASAVNSGVDWDTYKARNPIELEEVAMGVK
jgi:hypothetical protein